MLQFTAAGFATPESFSRCIIDFAAGTTKRSIGKWNDWDVKSRPVPTSRPLLPFPLSLLSPPGPVHFVILAPLVNVAD